MSEKIKPADELTVIVRSGNDRMYFQGETASRGPLEIDYIPPLGDNLGYMPLELFLISLAACAAGSVSVLLRRMGHSFTGLEVRASGVRRDTHPTSFEKITLHFLLRSASVDMESLKKALALSEKSICPVWAMVDKCVEIVTECEISA